MTNEEVRELEAARRKALWVLASLLPGDPKASEALAILDDLDHQERNVTVPPDTPLELVEARDSVPVNRHHSGIDIVLELSIPQPWRERFLQASKGSTRLPDGLYATYWQKFLVEWMSEMTHLEKHRASRDKSG